MFHNKFFIFISAFSLIFVASFVSVGFPAQAAQCVNSEAFCNGQCVSNAGFSTGSCGGGHGTYDLCNNCVCNTGYTKCSDSGNCVQNPSPPCQYGTTFNACTNQCDTPYVLRNPSIAQGDYITVRGTTLAVETAAPPEGSLFYNETRGSLRVKTGTAVSTWKDVGTNYTAERNIDSTKLATNLVAVVPDPTFDKLRIGVPASLDIGYGDLALNSGSSLYLPAATRVGVDTGFRISGSVRPDANSLGLTLNVSNAKNSELRLSQSNVDKWALSLRAPSSNFEIWRNVGGTWVDAPLKIINSTGEILVNDKLTVRGDVQAQANLAVEGLTVAKQTVVIGAVAADSPDARLSNYLTIRNMDNDSTSGRLAQNAIRVVDEDANEWFSVSRSNYLTGGNLQDDIQVKTAGLLVAGKGRVSGRIDAKSVIISERFPPLIEYANTPFVVAGNARIDGNLTLAGTISGITGLSGLGPITGSEIGSATSGGVLKLGNTPGYQLRLDLDDISTGGNPLYLQRYSPDARIFAGSSGVQLTSTNGGLKTANLANEDFNEGAEGVLMLGAKGNNTCTTVCRRHGLACDTGYRVEANSFSGTHTSSCDETGVVRYCLCKG